MTVLDEHTTTNQPDSALTLRPESGDWAGLLTSFAAERPRGTDQFRRELGLPTDRPVVMTGHQAQIWHPGILAKYLAADALAGKTGAAAAWIVVDQDTNPPGVIRLPVRRSATASAQRALRVETWPVDPAGQREHGDVPTARQRPLRVGAAPTLDAGESWAAPGVGTGIEAIRTALARHAAAPSAAAQMAGAVGDLLTPLMRRPGHTVLSLAISQTTLFSELVDGMRRDPEPCTREYNAAVAAHPRERIQPLAAGELPLWVIGTEMGSKRRRVTVAELASIATDQLAPRALLMTGMLRWAGCDLFIHGTGGGGGGEGHEGYDRITEQWLAAWLGEDARLAPAVVATATLRLRIGHSGPAPTELRRAQWLAHRARHEPRLLDDAAADACKRGMVEEIRRVKRSGGDAKPLYRDMHALLGRTRESHAARLHELQAAAESAAARVGDAEIAADRTWAFPLYEAGQLGDLRERVTAQFG